MRPGPAGGPGGDPTAGAGANVTRNALRFLTSASGLAEVRLFVVPKLEMWIMNPKVGRTAQELLMAVAMNCTGQSPGQDLEVIQNFLKLRFKNKPNINLFLACIREMVNANREANLPTLIKVTIFNELSPSRNPNNMAILGVMFNASPSTGFATNLIFCVSFIVKKSLIAWRANQ